MIQSGKIIRLPLIHFRVTFQKRVSVLSAIKKYWKSTGEFIMKMWRNIKLAYLLTFQIIQSFIIDTLSVWSIFILNLIHNRIVEFEFYWIEISKKKFFFQSGRSQNSASVWCNQNSNFPERICVNIKNIAKSFSIFCIINKSLNSNNSWFLSMRMRGKNFIFLASKFLTC